VSDLTAQSERGAKAFAAIVVVPIVLAVTLATFAWPAARLEPRDLPIGVAGSADATRTLERQLAQSGGAFDVHRYADERAAREAIEDREVYGAVVVSRRTKTVLTSTAASPLVAGLLEHAFEPPPPAAPATHTVDVVAADPDDPRGAVLGALVFPLVLASVIAAILVSQFGRPGLASTGALLGASALAGVVGIAMVQGWLGALAGSWLVNAGVVGLTMLAIASVLAGLNWLFGHVGLALGALTMVLVGNPWSGISSAPELLPSPIGAIGQLLPPGAGGNLLRSTSSFDGAGSGGHLTVLLAWATLGLAVMWAALPVQGRRSATPAGRRNRALRAA